MRQHGWRPSTILDFAGRTSRHAPLVTLQLSGWGAPVWIGYIPPVSIVSVEIDERKPMRQLYAHVHLNALNLSRRLNRLAPERGQGTVEYVGLILLVSLLMVGMVAAMKGFQGEQGLEIAEVIVAKIKSAVNAITFK
jgi:hypothetical protein